MRVLVVNWTSGTAGGAEAYLSRVLPLLAAAGHQLAMFSETEGVGDPIPLPSPQQRWCAASEGESAAVSGARAWRPDVVWTHILSNPRLEEAFVDSFPGVLFAHDYHGTCVSGTKTRWLPRPTACTRHFGPGCLLQYYPRRCGGLSPVTLARLYRREAARLRLARRYRAIVTLSEHMCREYRAHGMAPHRLHCLPAPPGPPPETLNGPARTLPPMPEPCRLLFLGRMDRWKGGLLLLKALPLARRALARPLAVSFAGDGPDRRQWEARASRISDGQGLSIRFTGWADSRERDRLFASHDVLVVPSLWPEPFGLVGLEAAAHGLPAVAFAVGGIPEWLRDDVSGCLAPGDPPSAPALARALARCLEDPARYAAMSAHASRRAARVSANDHVADLASVFRAATARQRNQVSTPARSMT